MSGRDEQPQAAAARPLRLKMRSDLVTHQQFVGGQKRWLVRDPLTLAHFQMAEEEFALLQMLNGRVSLDDVRAEFERTFAPKRLNVARLLAWAAKLHRDGLLIAESSGQAERLGERAREQRRSEFAGRLMNILAIRFRGVDPDRFLGWLHRRLRPLLTPWAVAGGVLLIVCAVILVVVQFDAVYANFPELGHMLHGQNLVCLLLVLAGTKVIHEFAHGVTCKHHGGECHELGVLLLVFTPCLYCDVSDAWSIRSRWSRIAVSAAGMFSDMILASIATGLWWFSRPGLLHTVCLDVMLVCGFSTLIFNGNPLLRYDGYFILADLVNMPNLATRAQAVLRATLSSWFMTGRRRDDESLDDRHRGWLLVYAVAATCYRWFLIVTILLFLLSALTPYRLRAIGQIIAAAILLGMVVVPANRTLRAMSRPAARGVRWYRVVVAATFVAAVLLGVCFVPLPCRLAAPILLEPHRAQRVYVSVPGTLIDAATVGERIETGAVIATLENAELQRELAELAGECSQHEARLTSLEAMRLDRPAASERIPEERKALANAMARLNQRLQDARQLQLRATRGGTVMAAPAVAPQQPARDDRREPAMWSGTPLDEVNRGTFLESGTLVCLVGDPQAFDAIAFADAAAIPFVKPGQRARIRLTHAPQATVECVVDSIAKADLSSVPEEMSRFIEIKPPSNGQATIETRHTVYQVRLRMAATDVALVDRMTGQARVYVAPQSLGQRLARYFSRTFTFMLGQ